MSLADGRLTPAILACESSRLCVRYNNRVYLALLSAQNAEYKRPTNLSPGSAPIAAGVGRRFDEFRMLMSSMIVSAVGVGSGLELGCATSPELLLFQKLKLEQILERLLFGQVADWSLFAMSELEGNIRILVPINKPNNCKL